MLNKRDPDGDACHIINQADNVLEDARNSVDSMPWPRPNTEEFKFLIKEIQISREKIAGLERELKVEEEKISQARMALAWLQLWEQNSLHPQKPRSSDFLKSEKGFALLKLGAQSWQKILDFELKQAKERL